jgi:LysR family transcriptional regulator for metE and metH
MLERFHLEVLVAIQQHGTLTKAADSLNLSQSALSHSIKKLEGQLGGPVWKKDGRNLQLTQMGEHILNVATRLLPQFSHTELVLKQMARGQTGYLRIGMECHPCYQWLLGVIKPYIDARVGVDIDIKQAFQFGGLVALINHEIDILVTPDPIMHKGVEYIPVFAFEHQLAVALQHSLAEHDSVIPSQLNAETLYSYPVDVQRLDIFTQFLNPAKCSVREHKTIETTEIMMQLVAAERGVCALPGWLIHEFSQSLPVKALRFGNDGIHKHINIGIRQEDRAIPYIGEFIDLAQNADLSPS